MTFDDQAAALNRKGVVGLLASNQQLTEHNVELRRQLVCLRNQIFGTKSERRLIDPDARQLFLGELTQQDEPVSEVTIAEHQRRSRKRPDKEPDESDLRFDPSVPVEEIRIPHPALDAIVGDRDQLRSMGERSRWIIDHRFNIATYMENVRDALRFAHTGQRQTEAPE